MISNKKKLVFSISDYLASETIHRNLPSHKAVLLAGPDGSGKELLVHIACNELGGILLDISPMNLARTFNTGK